ncbi:hypothetical protein [Hymenobacter latericus]|uniref:hypothetical protein n=1 Tax=Hymenobacter sp. YIM 151858-1 TaxID=2987688 RepID=UPI002225CB12|nr:hypothetical protein [Hymenobacter sp. YIM 151858-1]UYZ60101.1 hypothetical protein OIS50_04695 [Hymenobacter sp. YIM 151858-1]
MSQFSTIDKVVKQTCQQLGDALNRKYFDLLPYAYAWLGEHRASSSRELKTVRLFVGPDRVAMLPDDYVDWVTVGREYAGPKGEALVRNLAFNPRLSLLDPVEPFLDRVPLDECPDTAWPVYHYVGGESPVCGYGWGEYREEFTIDAQERTLRLSSLLNPDEPLYFQYVSNGLNPSAATPIHEYCHENLRWYLLWQLWLMKGDNRYQEAEKNYWRTHRKMNGRLKPYTQAMFEAQMREAFSQTPM